jgi:hypothetical protein
MNVNRLHSDLRQSVAPVDKRFRLTLPFRRAIITV